MANTKLEKKQTPEEIIDADADRWLETFSIFVHDLESPIASLKYLLKLIEEGQFNYEKPLHKSLTQASRIALERSESILYDIMAVAKSKQNGIPVSLTNVVPGPIIQESVDLVLGSAVGNNIDIVYDSSMTDVSVVSDPKLLRRMLDNLLFNAIRHTPSGKKIDVYAEKGRSCLFIHIKDSGEGLGDIDPSLLFEKFGQVELRRQGKHRGVGLGLYFCKLAATGMGGTVMADDHPDGGAVFSIKLKKGKG